MAGCCDICVDPNCGGKQNCNCDTCARRDSCYRLAGLKPTFRITRKCTQSCEHCCFSCDPQSTEMMSLETARTISQFCQANNITRAEAMGGEFFCHPQWADILHILSQGMRTVRLVSNGDWAGCPRTADEVVTFLKSHPQFHVGISRDRWHTNRHVAKALEYLSGAGIPHRVPTAQEASEETIVPVGRSAYECTSFFGMFSCYCHKPERRYNLLIDEEGNICKCGFGTWKYAHVNDYQTGGFAARFKEFNTKFYGVFISNCASCQRMEARVCRDQEPKAGCAQTCQTA